MRPCVGVVGVKIRGELPIPRLRLRAREQAAHDDAAAFAHVARICSAGNDRVGRDLRHQHLAIGCAGRQSVQRAQDRLGSAWIGRELALESCDISQGRVWLP